LWDHTVFLRSDVKTFFERVCVDGLSDSDIAAIVEEYAKRLTERREVCNCFAYTTSPSNMRSSLLLARFGKTYKRQKKMEQRNDSSLCVTRSAVFIPVLERVLTRHSRVIEKLKGEGWAEELEQHPTAYAALKDITGVRVAKTLTDRGTSLAGYL
jgi:hypothetical protein